MNFRRLRYLGAAAGLVGLASSAYAQEKTTETSNGGPEADTTEIIVTAQKREQSVNSVGLSISAISSDALKSRGINDTADLVKAVPGFTFTQSPLTTPVYSLRGIGLYDSGLASSPSVSVYVDEVPLPYPAMTQAASLDLERVEVLKGPQGTLFGQNSTGGAVNYIAAKPTKNLQAGGDLSYERFGRIDIGAFVSGPLSDTIRARLSVRAIEGGAWQKSFTRPDDRLGDTRKLMGRLLLDWDASDRLRLQLNINGWRDRSDIQAGQLAALTIKNAALAPPELNNTLLARVQANDRSADWSPDEPNRSNDSFYQGAVRADYDLNDSLQITSLTSYEHFNANKYVEEDGTSLNITNAHLFGDVSSFNQEIRLSSDTDNVHWIIGGNYDFNHIRDNVTYDDPLSTARQPIPSVPEFILSTSLVDQKVRTLAAFGNLEYQIANHLKAHAGIRYTDSRRHADICGSDPDAARGYPLNALFSLFQPSGTPAIAPGQCFPLTATFTAGGLLNEALNEDNVSWHVGLDYKTSGNTLIYANSSRGYKAGVITNISATFQAAYAPVKQERVDAYEVGIKAPLFGRSTHLNVAGFYYNYKDKQILGIFQDATFGSLQQLKNIPKSRIYGMEADLTVHPIGGLDLSIGGTYVNAKINGPFATVTRAGGDLGGISSNIDGSPIPYTPRVQLNIDGQYEWTVGSLLNAFFGANASYHSRDQADFSAPGLAVTDYKIPEYTLIDLRAGLSAPDQSWRLTLFGRNITNKYYWTNVFSSYDTRYRYTGRPATYGVSLSIRMR